MTKRKPKFEKYLKKLQKSSKDEVRTEKFLNQAWKFCKKESIRLVRWLFFYQPKDNMDSIFHIITVISYIIIGVALARRG